MSIEFKQISERKIRITYLRNLQLQAIYLEADMIDPIERILLLDFIHRLVSQEQTK
jgi:hypothetical protein